MQRKFSIKNITFLIFFVSFAVFSQQKNKKTTDSSALEAISDKEAERKGIKAYIQHHLEDTHDFGLYSYTDEAGKKVHVGAPLPVILWDGGLKIFSSSKLHHGETLAEVDGNYY